MEYANFEIRTDLALEEQLRHLPKPGAKDGVTAKIIKESEDITITIVDILTQEGSIRLHKPIGKYYTIEAPGLCGYDVEYHNEVSKVLSKCISELLDGEMQDKKSLPILAVGLGNREVTPDSIGPKAIDSLKVSDRLKAVAPGVLAQTGMETASIIKGVAMEVKPAAVLVIDALAARSVARVNRTIQLSNSGIYPGRGVGNHRNAINRETIGFPVIAIGVPTVVDAPTIIRDVLETIGESYDILGDNVPKDIVEMFVTPKDIDGTTMRIGYTIAEAINLVNGRGEGC